MADETTETVETTTTTEIVTPGGGIVTRTDGGPTPPGDWRASLPVELQAEKSLESFKDVGALAKGFVETKRLVGRAGEFPGPDAKPEQIAEYRKRAGVPESPDKYPITLPPPPEGSGMQWDPALVKAFLGKMHAAHARPEVVQAAIETYYEDMNKKWDQWRNQQNAAETEDLLGAIKELEKKWGPKDGPMWKHYAGRAELAIRTLMGDAPPAAIQKIVESTNDPDVAHAFSLLADSLLERGSLGEDEMPSALGSDDAQRKADEIRDAALKDPRHPLNDPNHPEHERVMKQYLEYNAVAAGPRGREVVAEARR